jgi:serine/threonine-protein kinase
VACLEENTLFEFLCGGLPDAARDAVADHAALCNGCRRMIAAAAHAPDDASGPAPWPPRPHRIAGGGGSMTDDELGDRADRVVAGKYRLVRLIGAGGMGTVHEAIHTWTGRRVAVKQLRVAYAADGAAARRFLREARSASRLAHPGVVEILDLGRDPVTGALYMVQELLAGSTLRRRLAERGALPIAEVARIAAPAIAALAAAHAAGVVHRDIKPDNLFLAREPGGGEITKLIDFGLSKQLCDGAGLAITRRGRQLGTPFYMAPEQLRGDPGPDDRVDVWSIGVVLFEAIAGARPFPGPSLHELVAQVLHAPIPRLADVAPAVPAAFAQLVDRALERDRDRRPRAAELDAELAALTRPARRATRGSRCRSAAPAETATTGGCTSRGSRRGSR